jgi:2'-5' RNA ligase
MNQLESRADMTFAHATYICLDLPDPQAQFILNIRKHQHDKFRAALPAEITIAGSSGVGVIKAGQEPAFVFSTLQNIATHTKPITASFGRVLRFPRTDIFVLTLQDETPFRELHQRIAVSGISFEPNPFPFQPHCTLRSRSPVSPEEEAELLSLHVPGIFTLDTLSVYMLENLPMTLLYQVKLKGS